MRRKAANIPVTVCGEMAGEPMIAPVLIGLGIRELSMSAVSVPEVKAAIRAMMAAEDTEALVQRVVKTVATSAEVRAMVSAYMFGISAPPPSAGAGPGNWAAARCASRSRRARGAPIRRRSRERAIRRGSIARSRPITS